MKHTTKVRSRVATLELQILTKTCQSVNSPRSLTVYLLAKYGELEQLLNLSIDHEHYDCPSAFADDYLVTEMLKKTKSQSLSFDREANAFTKWKEAEQLCCETNDLMDSFSHGLVTPTSRETMRILARARTIVHETLGTLTRRTLDLIYQNMEFGPGATTSVKGVVTRGRKFSNSTLTTSQCLLSFGLFSLPPLWKSQVKSFVVQDYNELSFVPKNSKVDRAITIENDLNIFVQKGIGAVIARKLLNLGIDTKNQWQENRALVSKSHLLDLCTIDLSSASDTLALNTVRYFVPDDWFELLCWARPSYSKYKDNLIALEKFSGMGCGFTFELETLIFHSILLASKEIHRSKQPVSTFGDDMICGNDIRENVSLALNFLGFKVNSDKSFGKTTFHESCGVDFFKGVNVRPFYLRAGDFSDEISIIYLYCNLIRRYANHRNGGSSCDSRFLPSWLVCLSKLPKRYRTFVPDFGYESNGIVGNFDEANPSVWRKDRDRGFSGYRFPVYTRRTVETQRYSHGAYIGSLSKLTSFTHGREPMRGRLRSGTYKTGYTLNWVHLGPWI